MYRRVLAVGATAAVIVGAGGTALALTGSSTTDGRASAGPAPVAAISTDHLPRAKARLFKHLSHGQFVTSNKNGFVTHDVIRGTVTAVSARSITVQAADRTDMTFVVDDQTMVRVRQDGHGTASSIDRVAEGDQVLVAGTGTSVLTARHVVDVKK